MKGRLEGKVAIVCGAGASAGGVSIGMASSITLAREGAKVFAVDRELNLALETQRSITQAGGQCELFECDISESASVAKMAETCLKTYGRIDVLFNNVGIFGTGGPLETSDDDFDRLIRINLKGTFLTCKAVLPAMLDQGGGSIINNASVSAIRYQMPSVAYSASKSGVLQITQNIGLQYAAKGIRCNSVLPGNILTDRLVTRLKKAYGEKYIDHVQAWGNQVPNGRVGEPWDVANGVLFLASDESKYVNATELVIDGGLSASALGHVQR